MNATNWQSCRAVRFDEPTDVRTIELRRGEWVVILAVGEKPQASPVGGPGTYTVDLPRTLHSAPFPILVVAMPMAFAVLLGTQGKPVCELPSVPGDTTPKEATCGAP
ncbi:hypothetical protein [Azospirillum doebereinerae]|uniref:Uncharacterized protein n=1 Tax=Azospirillum doebereinerae TaxID=92933 RepID=A0A3S0UYT5_9PROT|nr:hypothetical protein [Azospirillum doebereinerae]RUQ66009.1 hypothetical protein EJ913_24540 [Azospirillum doebereinerae]